MLFELVRTAAVETGVDREEARTAFTHVADDHHVRAGKLGHLHELLFFQGVHIGKSRIFKLLGHHVHIQKRIFGMGVEGQGQVSDRHDFYYIAATGISRL